MDGAGASGALCGKPFQSVHPSSYVLQIISRLRTRNLLTYEDSGWIELGEDADRRRALRTRASRGADASGGALRALSLSV